MSHTASEASRATARVGQVLCGKYRLDRILGVGGMATVYAATHRNGMELAVKVLHPELNEREDLRARFMREGMVANAVRHPGAVNVVDDDVAADGSAFLVMELLSGESLDAVWERCGRTVSMSTVLAIGFQLCDVLAVAHKAGIVHRDIKPQNLFLTVTGQLKVLDFGIARLREASSATGTDTGMLLGTPAFMAPEQAAGDTRRVGAASDLYGVGATLFTLASGAPVHAGDNPQQITIRTATTPARSLASVMEGAPEALVRIVDHALAFDPDARWPSAEAMRDALKAAHLAILGVPMPATIPLPRLTGLAWFRHTSSPPAAVSTAAPVAVGDRPASSRDGSSPASYDGADRRKTLVQQEAPPRVRRRVYAFASIVSVAALATAAAVGLRAPPGRESRPSRADEPSSASPASTPLSDVPAAMRSYRAGTQALHDANRDVAESSFLAASEADPGMGAAHLRYAMLAFLHERGGVAHAHFLKATGLRSTLGPADVTLLDAFAPVFDQQPPDWATTERRLAGARVRSPADTEVLYELAMVELQRNELDEAVATADAALAIDRTFAAAVLVKEAALQHKGDTDGVARAADQCLEASPQAAACVGLRIEALSPVGRCEEVERDARRLIAINPAGPTGFYAQAQAGAALGRSPEGLLESFKAEWKQQGDAAAWAEVFDRASLAALVGDGPGLARGLDAMDRVADEGRDAFEHMNAAWARVEASTELGDLPRAAAAASSFLDRKDAWQEDPGVDMQAIAFDVAPMMLRAQREGGKISEADFEQRRDRWLSGWRARIHPSLAGYLWIYGFAQTVRTPAEARAALEALPGFAPLPSYRPSFLADAGIGRTYLLADRADEAVPLLRGVTSRCDPFEDPFVYVQASLWLGEALEATGKKADACVAYAKVQKSWSGLGPRSITLRDARARATALGCPPGR